MAHRLTAEEIKEMRELVALGAYKDKVAEKFNVSVKTVYYHIRDLVVKRRRIYQKIPEEVKEKIRERVSETLDREGAAEEFKLSYATVCKITRDLPYDKRGRRPTEGLTENSTEILREIMRKGFFITSKENSVRARSAYKELRKKGFPIKRVRKFGYVTLFVKEAAKEALEALLSKSGIKEMCYHDSRILTFQMGLEMSAKDRKEILKELAS